MFADISLCMISVHVEFPGYVTEHRCNNVSVVLQFAMKCSNMCDVTPCSLVAEPIRPHFKCFCIGGKLDLLEGIRNCNE
jgi:hypothetical protein